MKSKECEEPAWVFLPPVALQHVQSVLTSLLLHALKVNCDRSFKLLEYFNSLQESTFTDLLQRVPYKRHVFRLLGFLLGFFSRFAFGNILVPLSAFFFFFLIRTSSAFLLCRNRNQFL